MEADKDGRQSSGEPLGWRERKTTETMEEMWERAYKCLIEK